MLFAEPPILPADDCYDSSSSGHLAVNVDVMNAVLADFAHSDCDVLLNAHHHPGSRRGTTFSSVDDRDDRAQAQYLRERFEPMLERDASIGRPREVVSLSLVLGDTDLDARYVDRHGALQQIDEVHVVGAVAKVITPNGARRPRRPKSLSTTRHRDFIRHGQQALIETTTFALVGCGGLGSIAAESLLRLGARRFILFDHDRLEIHNLNRWQGGRPCNVGRNKAELISQRLKLMAGPGAVEVETVALSVLDSAAMPALKRCDVVIGCLDNPLARFFLNRLSVQYLRPYFDAGVNIEAGAAVDFQDRYFAVIPGLTACAECTAYTWLDMDDVRRELTDEVTAEALRASGYVKDLPDVRAAASAYALNMRAVSLLTIELTNWVCDFRPLATTVAEWWSAGKIQRSDRSNHPEQPSSACTTCSCLLGVGDQAELPRPPASGHVAGILAEAREQLRSASSPPQRP